MNPDPAQAAQAAATEQNEEHWSLVSVAFGAVTGVIISMLIRPVMELLPGKLFEEFLSKTVETVFSIGLPILLGFIAAHIRRLDQFLQRYLATAALIGAILLSFSLWVHAGHPVRIFPIVSGLLTMVETWVFLLFCGGIVQTGLLQIKGNQEGEYLKLREADAQRIAADAVAAGDPDIAVTIFGLNAAGAAARGVLAGCLYILLLEFHMVAIGVVSTLDAYVFFKLSLLWSLASGIILAAATTRIVTFSIDFGERYSETIPIEEKYKGIQPANDDSGTPT